MKKGLFVIIVAFLAVGCGDGNVVIQVDPAVQRDTDIALIEEYLTNQGFNSEEVDTTDFGVRYVILDEGSGENIDDSDFIDYTYIGQFLSDTIFDTNIPEVADSIRQALLADSVGLEDKSVHELYLTRFSENRVYEPFFITYTSSGWNFPSGDGVVDGFFQGMAATFSQINVGGEVLLVIPSDLAYGTRGSGALIGPNDVLAFKISPVSVKKQ